MSISLALSLRPTTGLRAQAGNRFCRGSFWKSGFARVDPVWQCFSHQTIITEQLSFLFGLYLVVR